MFLRELCLLNIVGDAERRDRSFLAAFKVSKCVKYLSKNKSKSKINFKNVKIQMMCNL